MGSSTYKVPGGKLIKIHLEEKDGEIIKVQITGDFFLHPEDGIESLESGLRGIPLMMADLQMKIDEIVRKDKIEMFGFDSGTLAEAILLAKD